MVRLGKFKEAIYIKAKHYPKDRVAIIYGDKKITWKELNSRINKMANALKNLGIKKADKVAFLFYNSPQFIITNIAVQELGAIPVPMNFRYVASEMEFLLNNSDSVAFIFDDDALPELQKIRNKIPNVKHLIHDGPNTPSDMLNYTQIIQEANDKEIKVDLDNDDIAVIIYTGGTTGRPKGVMLTYENILSNEEMALAFLSRLLPSVDELDEPVYAKNELQRRLLEYTESLTGIPEVFFENPEMQDKIIVVETPSEIGPSLAEMTYAIREGKLKHFFGKPPEGKYHGLVHMELAKRLREYANMSTLSYSRRGKMKLIFKMIKLMLQKKIQVTGEKEVVKALKEAMRNRPQKEEIEKNTMVPPLFHLASYAVFLIGWMFRGSTVVFLKSKGFNPTGLLEIIEREQLKTLFLVPTMWKRVLDTLEKSERKYDLSSLSICLTGAAVLQGKYKKKVLQYFPNAIIVDAFGQSETAPVTTMKVDGDIDDVQDRCVGTIIDGLEMKVVDENNNPVPEGEVGEICYRGASVMKGYYKDPDKTAQTIDADRFLHSGDLGYVRNGQFFVVDRMKECINTGAEKVFPIEVEEVLIDHPKIDQVCVIGVPDEEWGEIVRAVVILKEGEIMTQEEVIQFVEGKIAGFKKPRSVLFVKEFPISPVGKVLRSKIREQFGKQTN